MRNPGNQHFSLFPTMFFALPKTNCKILPFGIKLTSKLYKYMGPFLAKTIIETMNVSERRMNSVAMTIIKPWKEIGHAWICSCDPYSQVL